MKKYLVTYTETFTGAYEVEAESEYEAIEKVEELIDSDKLDLTEKYDGHEVTVDYAEEVKE